MAVKFVKHGSRQFKELSKGVRIARDVSPEISSTMACSVAEFENCNMEWTVLYDEYIYGVEGVLTLETKEGTFEIGPGDGIWLPEGTWMIYKATKKAKTVVAVYPGNWREIHGVE